jgi:hypothetical protein
MKLKNCANILDEKTSPQTRSGYVTSCQICGWYGYPREKIIVEFEGIRPENEDGYIDIFTEYNYDTKAGEKGSKHTHKYNPKLVQECLDLAIEIRNNGRSCQE